MDTNLLKQISERARKDPAFFHALLFNPAQAMDTLGISDEVTRGGVMQMNPQQLLNAIVLPEKMCNPTCSGSCSNTCGGGGSCDITCRGRSCGYTCGTVSCSLTHAVLEDSGGAF